MSLIKQIIARSAYTLLSLSKLAKLSTFLCGYRKGYSVQHALISILGKWKVSLDHRGYSRAILMDLSKAFDTLNHELLIAKLHAYGFEIIALKTYPILLNREVATKKKLIHLLVPGKNCF